MCYPAIGRHADGFGHSELVDMIRKTNSLNEITEITLMLRDEIKKKAGEQILISSEKLLELLIENEAKFICFCDELKRFYDLFIVYVIRDCQAIVDSGIRHFVNIMSKSHVIDSSKYFGFRINQKNHYFDFNDVKRKMYLWIENAYHKIENLNFQKIKVIYQKDNCINILSSITKFETNTLNQSLLFMKNKLNTNPIGDRNIFLKYCEFCKANYESSDDIEFITYKEFYEFKDN